MVRNMAKGRENRRRTGSKGEDAAVEFLKKNGYSIVARNFRFGRMGEIDIIAKEKEYICFIEVKSRSGLMYGHPSESVNSKKRENIIKLALIYLKQHHMVDSNIRFDVIEIIHEKSEGFYMVKSINLIRNAFC